MEDKRGEATKICWDGREKSHQNIFKNQEFQSVWNLKLLFPPFCLHKEFLLFQDMEHDKQHPLCPERWDFPPPSTHLNYSTIYKKKKKRNYIYLNNHPTLPVFHSTVGRRKNCKQSWLVIKVLFHPHQHQYPCNPLYTFCTEPCFNSCLRPAKETKALPCSTNRRRTLQVLLIAFTDRTHRPCGTSLELKHTFLNDRNTLTPRASFEQQQRESPPGSEAQQLYSCFFSIPTSRNKTK